MNEGAFVTRYFEKEQARVEKATESYHKKLVSARGISRGAIYKIVILSASIVGFSASLFSIPLLRSTLNLTVLRYSWYSFLGVIILGMFILLFEGRISYGVTWKSWRINRLLSNPKDYSLKEKLLAILIVV